MRLEVSEGFSHQVTDAGCPWSVRHKSAQIMKTHVQGIVASEVLDLQHCWPGTRAKTAKMPRSAEGKVLKVIWSLWAKSPKRVSCTARTLFCTGRNTPKHSPAPCKRLFWDSHFGAPKTPCTLSLKHFWTVWLFDNCTRPAGSQFLMGCALLTTLIFLIVESAPCFGNPSFPRPLPTIPSQRVRNQGRANHEVQTVN